MLLRVGIDPDAGEELAEGARGPGPMLVRHLREHCLLVADSGAAAADLVRVFQTSGSPELAQAIAMLVQTRLLPPPDPAPTPLQSLDSIDQISSWRDVAELLVLAEYRIDGLACSGPPTSTPEVVSLRDALNARAVDAVNELWQRPRAKGEHRDEVWRECFAPFALHTRRVYIVDGYAGANLLRALEGSGGARTKSGAEWFLGHLARSPVKSVHLACSARPIRDMRSTVEHAHEAITAWFNELGSGTNLNLQIIEGSFDHGRRVAFEGWAGFDIHNGLASFDKPYLSEGMGLNASAGLGREVIHKLRSLASAAGS